MMEPSPMMMEGPGKMMGDNYPGYGAGKMMGDFGGKMMGDNYPGSQHRGGFPGDNFNNMQHQGNFRDSYQQPTFGGNRRYQGEHHRPGQYGSNYQGGFGGQRQNYGGKHSQYPMSRQGQYW